MTVFPAQLWHGTSGHLLPLIEQHGLGGMNVMEHWRVMPFLKWAFPKLQISNMDYDDDDFIEVLPIRAAVDGGAAGMNFVYGHVYAAGGYHKAAEYAQTAPEQLSFVRTVVAIADGRGLTSVWMELEKYPEIEEFLSLDPKPVVLELSSVPMSSVSLEMGGALFPSLFDKDQNSEMSLSQTSFRVGGNIPFRDIKVVEDWLSRTFFDQPRIFTKQSRLVLDVPSSTEPVQAAHFANETGADLVWTPQKD